MHLLPCGAPRPKKFEELKARTVHRGRKWRIRHQSRRRREGTYL